MRLHRLLILALTVQGAACIPLIAAAQAGTLDRTRVMHVVDSIVGVEIAAGRVAGMTVAMVRGRDTLLLKPYGRANLELDVPTPDEAVYDIASQAKTFTAAAVMLLMEQGKLSPDDPVAKHLPGVLPADAGGRVTVRHLLTHTSGIPEYSILPAFIDIWQRSYPAPPPADTILKLVAPLPLAFEPGTAMVYSNSGYHLLGALVERVSGKSLEDYLAAEVFPRAGMRSTRRYRVTEIIPNLTSGYVSGPNGLRPGHGQGDHWWNRGASGFVSTAADVARWLQALHGSSILGAEAYQALVAPGTLADGTPLRYGSGVALQTMRGHRAFSHGGAIPSGYNSFGAWLPDDSLAVVVLSNTLGGTDTEAIVARIVGALLGDRRPSPTPFAGPVEPYLGTYRSAATYFFTSFRIAAADTGGLTVSIDGGAPLPLAQYGEDRFATGNGYMFYTFLREGGVVTGVRVEHPVGVMRFRKETAAPEEQRP
ncbi:serine hydrolase domain-containing protein [Longimicrobium sp.]|uniref:serine hydrolase domain-containing protein n=1 Tax=Longimicrobium sp. TaxID=2029185 RepID=UPI003B3B23A8